METGNAYRRGTILGLTFAEVFILLTFLLLLLFLGLSSHWRDKEKEYEDKVDQFTTIAQHFTPKEIETLVDGSLKRNWVLWRDIMDKHTPGVVSTWLNSTSIDRWRQAEKTLRATQEELRATQEELRATQEELRATQEELHTTVDQFTTIVQHFTPKEIETLVDGSLKRNWVLWRDIMDEHTPGMVSTWLNSTSNARWRQAEKTLRTTQEELHTTQETLRKAQGALRVLQKGHNPPCWYEIINAGGGNQRERPHYIFNIAIHDEAMVVNRRSVPRGGAADDTNLLYKDEAVRLNLDDIPYDTPLTNKQLEEHMEPIHELGKSEEIRSYSCVFFVKVWDKTSPDAKPRWKSAHNDILERLFGTYVVKNELWPGA